MVPVLRMLDEQKSPDGVVLYLWNNARRDHHLYLEAIESVMSELGSGTVRRIEIVRSPFNIGSIGRFYWARKLDRVRPASPVVVIDDDEDLTNDFLEIALREYRPDTISAWWAWRITGSYWEREAAKPGEHVDHIGPGGSVMSSSIFRDRAFFTQIPREFSFLDDIWLSHYARARGMTLAKLPVEIKFVMEETNQYHGQTDLKPRFYEYLSARR